MKNYVLRKNLNYLKILIISCKKLLKEGGNMLENYEIHNNTFSKEDTQEIIEFISGKTKYTDLQIINILKIIFNNTK